MKKILSAFLTLCLLVSALSISAFAYTTGGSVGFTQLGNTTSQISVTDQQDFDNWYAEFLENGSEETHIALFLKGPIVFTGEYDLSKFYLSFEKDATISEGATVICQALQFSSCSLTNNGTLIITGENQYNTKLAVGFRDTSADIFTNNGTLIFRKGNQIAVLKNVDESVVSFVNNGTIYTEDGTLTNNSYSPAVITNGTGTLKQMNTLATENGSTSGSVKVSYKTASTTENVYSVDVQWDSMSFTYTQGGQGTWNTNTHAYENPQDGTWSETNNTVTVVNHSNVAIDATLTYTSVTAYSAITGAFTEASGTANDGKLELATAAGTEVDAAPTATAALTLKGALAEGVTNTKIGTVTVTIAEHFAVDGGEGELID